VKYKQYKLASKYIGMNIAKNIYIEKL